VAARVSQLQVRRIIHHSLAQQQQEEIRLLHQDSQAQLTQRQLEEHKRTHSLAYFPKAQPRMLVLVHLRQTPSAACSVERKEDKETHWLRQLRI
jgi:hypothetical protein